MVKSALLIGINYYNSDHQLSGCINDIVEMKKYLYKRGYTDFVVLQDGVTDTTHAEMDCPTRANILAAMDKAISKLTSGDYLFVHYSGHGSQLDDTHHDKKNHQDSCICPVDFDFNAPDCGFIRDFDLNAILVKKLPAGAKLRVIFDACHSGSALDLPYRYNESDVFYAESDDKIARDIIFISGCKDSQTSADSRFNNIADGALSWALMEAFEKLQPKNTWRDLIHAIRKELHDAKYDQLPQLDMENKSQLLAVIDV